MIYALAVMMVLLPCMAARAQTTTLQVDGNRITIGPVRIEVLTPTLLRLEYAEDRQFENGTTFNAINRNFPIPQFTANLENGHLVVKTQELSLSYGIGSGIFATQSTEISVDRGDGTVLARPDFNGPGSTCNAEGACHIHTNLGGWFESLDAKRDAVAMHDGILSRDGWFLLNDTQSDLYVSGGWPKERGRHKGEYQDGYFFGYGLNYKQGLHDFVELTGKTRLLPRWAFGIWLGWLGSCCSNSAQDYETKIIPAAASDRMPIDVLAIDTPWKAQYTPPNNWNGWAWSPKRYPHPVKFIDWATEHGIHIGLNIHPSISHADPKYPEALKIAGTLLPDPDKLAPKESFTWDFSRSADAKSYFFLHQPLMDDGVRFFWLDACCGEGSSSAKGVTPADWLNELYVLRATPKGKRGFVISRIGGTNREYGSAEMTPTGPWTAHRNAIHFTGDTHSTWSMLAAEVTFTAQESGIAESYVSHDISGYQGDLSSDLYLRWVEFGTFSPIFRFHGDGEKRLPWQYPTEINRAAIKFLQLRERLVPYIYTAARTSYDTGLTIVRPLYIEYPEAQNAYNFGNEYMFGSEFLVAPIANPGDTAQTSVWFPKGTWFNFFTGEEYSGPQIRKFDVPLDRMPVFVKAGSIIPFDADSLHVETTSMPASVRVYPGPPTEYKLYQDAGEGLGYQEGKFSWRTFRSSEKENSRLLQILPASGAYNPGEIAQLEVIFEAAEAPVGVKLDHNAMQQIQESEMKQGYWFDSASKSVHVRLMHQEGNTPIAISVLEPR